MEMADSKSREMTRRMFRNVSLAAVASLTLLAAVQCVWAWRIYRDAVEAFRSRVESAAYKSVYEAFRTDPFGRVTADDVNVDLDDFGLYFTANMLETGTLQPYCAEVVDRADGDRIVMRRGDVAAIAHPAVSEIDIDDGGASGVEGHGVCPRRRDVGRDVGRGGAVCCDSGAYVLCLGVAVADDVPSEKPRGDAARPDTQHNP